MSISSNDDLYYYVYSNQMDNRDTRYRSFGMAFMVERLAYQHSAARTGLANKHDRKHYAAN